jgi:hypothetical protein
VNLLSGGPRDIFISHAGEDEKVVQRLAQGLERDGFTTWYYERDNTFLETHLVQTKRAIDRAKVVVVLASPHSVRSHEVTTELQAAHSSAKPVAPLLLQLTWNEIKEQNELWTIIFGAATALTLDPNSVTDVLPRIIAGLTAMGVAPSGTGALTKSIGTEYPLPIAATYVQKLGRPWGPEQAVQAHEAIRDLAEALIAYLAVLVVCRYRQLLGTSTLEDGALESELENFREPALGDWARLLYTTLGAQVLANDELVGHLSKFLNSRRDQNDTISTAAAGLRDWTGERASPARSLTNRDFIDLLSSYAHMPKGGWGSLDRLSVREECQRRVDLLRPALERILLDLFFLTRYPLVYVQECLQAPDGIWSHQVCDAMGRDVAVRSEPLRSPKPLESSHVYLCRYEGKSLQPMVDLDPLLVFQDCPTCGVPSILLATVRKTGRAEGVSPSCRHRTEWDERRSQGLTAFFSLFEWRTRFQRAEFQPYVAALDEVMSGTCEISPEDRQKVNFLAKALHIPDGTAKHLEDQVVIQRRRRIDEKAQLEKTEREKAERERAAQEHAQQEELRRKTEEEAREAGRSGRATQPSAEPGRSGTDSTTHFKRLWREDLGATPTHAVLFGTPPFAFVIDESGAFSVFSRDGRVVFRDRVLGRAFTVTATADRVFVGTWQGGLYCIGPRELLWQRYLDSPVSRVHAAPALGLLVGTWEGRVSFLRQDDGTEIWSVSLDDGISALTASPDSSSLYVGSYSGNLARLDPAGRTEWIRDVAAGVMQVAVNGEADILVATRNGVLTCLEAHTQEALWEHFCESPLEDVAFSLNRRFVTLALRSGKLQVCGIDGGVHVRAERTFEHLRETLFSGLAQGGRFLSAVSGSEGFSFFDGQESSWTTEVESPVTCAFFSADGRSVLAGGDGHVELLRLAAPALATRLVPLGEVRKGSYTRVRIMIDNSGERLARDIAVEFSGPVEARPLSVTQDLLPGETAVQENHLMQPKEDGAVPVKVRLSCIDDRGIQHVFETEHVLDVGRLSTAREGASL